MLVTYLLLLASFAEDLSPAQAVAIALERHPLVEAQAAHVEQAEGGRQQANLKPNLTLYAQQENARVWAQPQFSYRRDVETFVYLGQTIETAGKRQKRTELARTQVEGARLERELTGRQVALRVSQAYWAAAGAARLAELATEQAEGFAGLVENNRQRVKEGVLPGVDLIRSEIELRRLRASAGQVEMEARRARVALFREMAAEDAGARLSGRIEDRRELAGSDVGGRVEWRQAEQQVRVAGANVELQQAMARPDPQLLYGYKRATGFDTVLGGLVVDLPWRNRNQGNIAAAVAAGRAAEAQRRALRVQLEADLQTALNEMRGRRLLLDETLLPAQRDTEEVMRLGRRAYLEGGIDLLRLIDAERVFFETRMQVVRTQTELRQAEANLAFATGEQP